MKIRVTKRGEIWSCCDRWRDGDICKCDSFIAEFFDAAGAELHAKGEGPRPSDRRAP